MKKTMLLTGLLSMAVCGCGNTEPVIYRTTMTVAPFQALPDSCFITAPTTTDAPTNADLKSDWTLWSGTNLQYLDIGSFTDVTLGDAAPVSFLGMAIEGGPTAFTESNIETDSADSTTTTTSITVTFSGTPGNTSAGTIEYKSATSCTGCGVPNCDVTANFIGRKVDTQPTSTYGG